MKILHLPLTVPGSEQVGQEKGFRQVFGDENYRQFDYLPMEGQIGKEATNQALLDTVKDFQPDIIWAQIQETTTITPKTWEFIHNNYPHIHLTTWSGDARDYVPQNLQQILPFFTIFYNDTDQVDMYKPHLGNCRYEFMPIAVDPDEATDYSHPTPEVPEIIFIGNHYGDTFSNGRFRFELMKALSKEFGDRFGVFGTGWPQNEVNHLGMCPVKHQGAYYNKAKIVISVDHVKGILHHSERLPWALASGSYVLMEGQRNFADWLPDLNAVVDAFGMGSAEDAIKKVYEIYQKEVEYAGKDTVLSGHTWKSRAEQVRLDYERAKS